jgi:hypothetical protein
MSSFDSESDSAIKPYDTDLSSSSSEEINGAEVSTRGSLQSLISSKRDANEVNRSNLFVKKPPIVPRRLSISSIKSDQVTRTSDRQDLFLNEKEPSRRLSTHTPQDSFRSCIKQVKIAPQQKIVNSELIIKKMLYEYVQSVKAPNSETAADQIALKEYLLNEYITLTALNLIGHGELSLNYANACIQLAEFYLEYKKYPKQAEKHSKTAEQVLTKIGRDQFAKNEDYYYTWMHLYAILSKSYTLMKK